MQLVEERIQHAMRLDLSSTRFRVLRCKQGQFLVLRLFDDQNLNERKIDMSKLEKDELDLAKEVALKKIDVVRPILEQKLSRRSNTSSQMEYGQIKSAARYTVKNFDHEWILSQGLEDKYVRMYAGIEIKRLVKKIAGTWHENPGRVWLQFRNYCMEMSAASLAKEVIKKFTLAH